MKERDEARKALEESKKSPEQDVLAKLDEFKQVTSSPEYIQASMKAQGYTQEAINKRLEGIGVQVPQQQDSVQLILDKLKIDPKMLSDEQRAYVSDIAKIADVLFQEKFNQFVPAQLKPIMETLDTMKQTTQGEKLYDEILNTVKSEGVLDFKTDIEPALTQYMEQNPKATQADIKNAFIEINHKLSIERLKTRGKKETRDDKKKELRQNVPGQTVNPGELPKRQAGQDISKYIDTILDATGIRH